MSIRAWLVRWKIRKSFRGSGAFQVDYSDPEAVMAGFRSALEAGESLMPRPPAETIVEPVDGEGVRGEWLYAPGVDEHKCLFFAHGGGYVWGSPKLYREFAWRLSVAADCKVFLLDYSLAPDHQYPTQLNEAVKAYHYVANKMNGAANMAIAGDSAGGNLTLALAHALKEAGTDLPASIALVSPWLDLSGSGDSIRENADRDIMLDPRGVGASAQVYCGNSDVTDPLISPLFADQSGLPPVLIQVGSTEILRSDSERLAAKLKAAGVPHQLDVWKNMHHVWHMTAFLIPEGKKAIADMGTHFRAHWR